MSAVENGEEVVARVSDGPPTEDIVDTRTTAEPDSRSVSQGGHRSGIARMPTTKDAESYNMNHKRRGKALLFNHMYFEEHLGLRARNGTNVDRDNLRARLRELDFEVFEFQDLKYKQVEAQLNIVASESHSDCDCLVIVVLTHGDRNVLYAKDSVYKPDTLFERFTADKCPTLAGKPKIFFLQACQGDELDGGISMVRDRTETDSAAEGYKIPIHADFLVAYSTIPGFYSWRNTSNGAWFIQALCHVLRKYGQKKDLLGMLTVVNREVAVHFESNVPGDPFMHNRKQIPCVMTMLTRDVYFPRKKI